MAYRRRYLAGQLAVTVDIAQQAITTDKIGDEAVGGAQLKDDSVSTDKIVDGDVKAVDIGSQAVETSKLKDGAVTTIKIADEAITTEKLSSEVASAVRPLTPGVATVEIADSAVTAAKIGAEAVETAKIKDGAVATAKIAANAVTTDKIAPDSIGSDQIIASAIKTSELDNLSVSEGKIIDGSVAEAKIATAAVTEDKIDSNAVTANKIAPLAVVTAKIDDDAVTEPKLDIAALARRHWNSLTARESLFHEDFGGMLESNRWTSVGAAGGAVGPIGVGGLRIQTGPVLHDLQTFWFGGKKIVIPNTHKPSMVFQLTGMKAPVEAFRCWFGLRGSATEYIAFAILDIGGSPMNWNAQTRDGGADTTTDTGIIAINGVQLFHIDAADPASIKFYINEVLVATHTTNIPATKELEPWFYMDTGEAVLKYVDLKYVNVVAQRPVFI